MLDYLITYFHHAFPGYVAYWQATRSGIFLTPMEYAFSFLAWVR